MAKEKGGFLPFVKVLTSILDHLGNRVCKDDHLQTGFFYLTDEPLTKCQATSLGHEK